LKSLAPSTVLRTCFRRSKIRRNVSHVNMSTVCSDKGKPVRHARPSTALRIDSGGHPGWTAKELDSRFSLRLIRPLADARE
jgi:hypothetical protein